MHATVRAFVRRIVFKGRGTGRVVGGRGEVEVARLKADIYFVYVVRCQDAAIFYESKTAFLASNAHAASLPGKEFFTCLYAGKVAFAEWNHEIFFSKLSVKVLYKKVRGGEQKRQVQ